jgi:hypothetical protein
MNTQNIASPSETTIIRAKDLMLLIGCGENTAFKLLKDIKDEYHLKRVLYYHVKKYLSIL